MASTRAGTEGPSPNWTGAAVVVQSRALAISLGRPASDSECATCVCDPALDVTGPSLESIRVQRLILGSDSRRLGQQLTKDNLTQNAATPSSKWRRYAGWAVGVLATFGIFGAVGSNLVDEIFPAAKEKISGAPPLRVTVREDPQGGSDGFSVAAKSPAGMESKLR